jgi:hypothetical protein
MAQHPSPQSIRIHEDTLGKKTMFAAIAVVALTLGGIGTAVTLNSGKENVLQAGSFHEQSVAITKTEQPTKSSNGT